MKKPFDELATVTHLLELYKNGFQVSVLATKYKVSERRIKEALNYWLMLEEKRTKKDVLKDKYPYVTDEIINSGLSYKEICKKQGIKIKCD